MTVRTSVRSHIGSVTAALTAISLAVVFGAVFGAIPATILPEPPAFILEAIPHLNAFISVLAIATITLGWWSIRAGRIDRHRTAMLTGLFLFALFLVLYLYRLIQVGGAMPFPGPETVYLWVYLPVLIVHMGLAIICIPLLYYVALLGLTVDPGALHQTAHPTVGRIAATLWLVSFTLGIAVYLLLHQVY